jgi:hypothetical protein
MTEIIARDGCDLSALVAVDGGLAWLDVACAAGFHFDEAENIFVPADEIDFSAAARGAEISRDDRVADLTQVEVRGLFAAAPGQLVRRRLARRQGEVGEPIERSESCEDEWTGKHVGLCLWGPIGLPRLALDRILISPPPIFLFFLTLPGISDLAENCRQTP